MPERARRITDPLEGPTPGYIEVTMGGSGDAFVEVHGQNIKGEQLATRIQLVGGSGGGYHPRTIHALWKLLEAIREDNADPNNPPRYRERLGDAV